jgi:hypothetical protein
MDPASRREKEDNMMYSGTTGSRLARRGTVSVMVAASLTVLMGMMALTLDGGMLLTERRRAQATCDAAAMAAATVLYQNAPSSWGNGPSQSVINSAKQAAKDLASANGYTNDKVTSVVHVHSPPSMGPYANQNGYVEVIVQYNMPRFFSTVFGSGTVAVTARSVAQGQWATFNAGVLILDYTGYAALNAQGNGAMTETGGPVIINSNNTDAVVDAGNGVMKAQEFDITGGLSVANTATFLTAPVANQVFTGLHPTPDPLAYLPVPSVPPDGVMTQILDTITLTPGRYTNLPVFTQGQTVILQQATYPNGANGIYYLDGCGFQSTGANIIMDAVYSGGVMIYNKPSSTDSSQGISITGNPQGSVNIVPLTSGPYTGMSFWQDRNSAIPVQVAGNGTFNIDGTFYAAGATLTITGNGGVYTGTTGETIDGSQIGSQFISKDLNLAGNGDIVIKYRGNGAARTKLLRLVE